MGRRGEVRSGRERLRVGAWRGSDRVGLLTPVGAQPPSVDLIRKACAELRRRGFDETLTGALTADEVPAFEAAGFAERDALHLLRHDLGTLPPSPLADAVSPGRRRDRRGTLAVDALAFPPFWQLDRAGLIEALTATPVSWFRVVREHRRIVGYAVTGLADRTGYLQRLAVDPDHGSRGLGRALVADALRWTAAGGARTTVVNTQVTNERALALYRDMGFRPLSRGLVVLGRSLDDRESVS